jgi:hypothetical protein
MAMSGTFGRVDPDLTMEVVAVISPEAVAEFLSHTRVAVVGASDAPTALVALCMRSCATGATK